MDKVIKWLLNALVFLVVFIGMTIISLFLLQGILPDINLQLIKIVSNVMGLIAGISMARLNLFEKLL